MLDESTALAGQWVDRYAKTFHTGERVQAWDHSPRTKKGKKVAEIILTAEPFKQHISLMTEEDFEKEGFAYLDERSLIIWDKGARQAFDDWKCEDEEYWVIDFKLIPPTA